MTKEGMSFVGGSSRQHRCVGGNGLLLQVWPGLAHPAFVNTARQGDQIETEGNRSGDPSLAVGVADRLLDADTLARDQVAEDHNTSGPVRRDQELIINGIEHRMFARSCRDDTLSHCSGSAESAGLPVGRGSTLERSTSPDHAEFRSPDEQACLTRSPDRRRSVLGPRFPHLSPCGPAHSPGARSPPSSSRVRSCWGRLPLRLGRRLDLGKQVSFKGDGQCCARPLKRSAMLA